MSEQTNMLDLFAGPSKAPPLARSTDHDTSHEAGNEQRKSGRQSNHMDEVLKFVGLYPGRTYRELHNKYLSHELRKSRRPVLEAVEFQRRLNDLAPRDADGNPAPEAKVRRAEARVCSASGRRAQTWWLVYR